MKLILTAALALTTIVASFSPNSANAKVLLETDFSNTTLYPAGKALGAVNEGLGTWAWNSAARVQDLGDGKRGVRLIDTGYSFYTFPETLTEGKITVEFSVIPYHSRGYFDIQLGNGSENENIGPQIRLGANTVNEVTYYDGSAFIAIPDVTFTENSENTFKFTAHLSGEKAGKFDFYANGVLVGENLVWRNELETLTNLRIRTTSAGRYADLLGVTITYEAIPEPSSVALGLTGLLLFGGMSRYLSK